MVFRSLVRVAWVRIDTLEYMFYTVPVFASRIGAFVGKLRSRNRHKVPRCVADRTAGAAGVLVLATSGRPERLALQAATVLGSSESAPRESGVGRVWLPIKAEPSNRPLRLRRGEGAGPASYEILEPMGSPGLASDVESDVSSASSDGVSAFIARVLDQLALSAWLPAAFLIAGAAVLLEFRSLKSASILGAVGKLTAHPLQVLTIMIPLLIVATVVTQAFSFEAIRALEGYWGRRGISGFASKLMIRRHHHKKRIIIERRQEESVKAFRSALSDVVLDSDDVTGRIARAVLAQLSGRSSEAPDLQGSEVEVFVKAIQTWRDQADAWRLARVDRLLSEEKAYPVDSRILPTRLGNLIRATEDELRNAGGDVRSFVLRQRGKVSRRVQIQHDQFRTRLDMYCTMVFVSLFLAAISPVALVDRVGPIAITVTSVSFIIMAVASYLAAITSAGGYCTALKQMDAVAHSPDED
jgi:hypothetical protein